MKKNSLACVYIMTNKRNGTLYTGVTSNLERRVMEHKIGKYEGFTKKYNLKILVYYSCTESMEKAIDEEKRIKSGSRKKKLNLIEKMNPA